MTYDEVITALNKHADTCATCGFCRKIGDTRSCCDEGKKILEGLKNVDA